jgi:hypothetical protein
MTTRTMSARERSSSIYAHYRGRQATDSPGQRRLRRSTLPRVVGQSVKDRILRYVCAYHPLTRGILLSNLNMPPQAVDLVLEPMIREGLVMQRKAQIQNKNRNKSTAYYRGPNHPSRLATQALANGSEPVASWETATTSATVTVQPGAAFTLRQIIASSRELTHKAEHMLASLGELEALEKEMAELEKRMETLALRKAEIERN